MYAAFAVCLCLAAHVNGPNIFCMMKLALSLSEFTCLQVWRYLSAGRRCRIQELHTALQN